MLHSDPCLRENLTQGFRTNDMVACLSYFTTARLAQSAERKALNLVVVGSSPTVGALYVFLK